MRCYIYRCLVFFVAIGGIRDAYAQLDSIHWIPPMHARSEYGPHYLYLSTPEPLPFEVEIRLGDGTLVTTLTISNSQPQRFDVGLGNDTHLLIPENQLHKPLTNKGFILTGPKDFFVNFRAHSFSQFQAGDLTCKGRAALGTTFRIGHLIQEPRSNSSRSNFIGVMATEDNTVVTISDFDAGVDFRINGVDVPSGATVQTTLQKGQSAVFAQYVNDDASTQPPNGLIGALLEATAPIAVNCGSWLGAPVNDNANDIGIDQIAPFELMGEEYILCKGNGSAVLETPYVIAHRDGTRIWINNITTPVAILNAGERFQIQTWQYSPYGNLYIRSSEPVFVYQIIGGASTGDDQMRTAGLIFVPPVSCGIPNAVDNIYRPNQIGSMNFDGGLMIVAMKDSAVTLRVNNNITSLGSAEPVLGNPDFVTYRRLSLFSAAQPPNTVSIVAQGAVQVALFGRNQPASFAAFYSGFSRTSSPSLDLSLIGDGVCPDTLVAQGVFDGVEWVYEDSILQFGPDSIFIAYAPGHYKATGYLGVCRRTDFAQDTLSATFVSPQFPYEYGDPSCFLYTDGWVHFGEPYGGLPPYSYSVDNGQHFTTNPENDALGAGVYKLVVKDVTGCYNRPLDIELFQPDSFLVSLDILRIDEPVLPGETVVLQATPSRPIFATDWGPETYNNCSNCLIYSAHPQQSGPYEVAVTDALGCQARDSVWINVQPPIYAPTAFHPGSESGNQRFTLFSKEPMNVLELKIFDRWGDMVFQKQNFNTNDVALGWDGTHDGKLLNPALFVYYAEVEYGEGYIAKIKGEVVLMR